MTDRTAASGSCVADRAAAYVSVIDVKGLKVVKPIAIATAPWGVAISQQ